MADSPLTAAALGAELQRHFGFATFRQGQAEAVQEVLAGADLLLVMPTGSGKSLCFQLASLLLPGVTLVVSPLIALMKDQVDGLAARGIPATFLNSSLSAGDMAARLHDLRAGRYKLVYLAPERFRNARFIEALAAVDISLFTVDEAHCISQWGHDFRPDYLHLRHILQTLPRARVLAVTATATPAVRDDIIRQLGLGVAPRAVPHIRVHGFARPNLHLAVTRTPTHDVKSRRLDAIIAGYRRGIVYCATRKMTERVAHRLRAAGHQPLVYHGALSDAARAAAQDRFMADADPIVVATNAFGMGVDRKDLRFVVHWDVPGSVEAYYQEVGRAGRDGGAAWCELLFNYADVRTQRFFLEGATPSTADVLAVRAAIARLCAAGPAEATDEELSAASGQKNDMGVRAALALLERAGFVTRMAASGGRGAALALTGRNDEALLKPLLAGLEIKRRLDEERLEALLAYVDYRGCRHAFFLKYFGETGVAPRCAVCDRCVRRDPRPRAAPTEDQWIVIQKILSCVGRMQGGRHGADRVIRVLRGEAGDAPGEQGLDQLTTFGLLPDESPERLAALLQELQAECCLHPAGSPGAPLALTAYGLQVVQRRAAFELAWPARDDSPRPRLPASARACSAHRRGRARHREAGG
jgi:ATP-dependent DNA helicase RecQ